MMNKTYEDGLNEAWEAARKVLCDKVHEGYTLTELGYIFGNRSLSEIFSTHTASEAIEKIKEYENSIIVGDEIYSELTNCKAVVQRIDAWNRYQCFTDNGSQFVIDRQTFNDYWVKTGNNYPQIAEVLKQMRKSEK